VVSAALGVDDEVEVVRDLRQVVEIVAVHMPGKDAQASA
jgi:hypothetical protein